MLFGEIIGVYCDNQMNALIHYVVQHKSSYITVDNTYIHHLV